ncbi:4-hydroxybenzoyl-CoA thioesterase [Prauserella marina]|uniref:Acyl-CoA thioester hydrolase n=1 Tax=Prauserella marina TaxID=530584 RepID=A0A222VRC4_9PSEU|nr:thioesterase family protein [Prauserella marina]ASR36440.1 4-hydroxybenzoyl-CoA thioesterase [Prauserella marina]PWV77252.1 (3S)-malyl-CoA thioesterase [Prauserella marina]SDD07882.1 acyl-CoA thioester hydrolase [Prauserella marina]
MADHPRAPVVGMPLRVRYHECDQQGIVFNAHYLAYADMAAFEFYRVVFGSAAYLTDRGIDMVVAETTLRYRRSAVFEDELVVSLSIEHIGNTSLVLGIAIHRGNELVLDGSNRYVWVDIETHRPTPPPEDVRQALRKAAETAR